MRLVEEGEASARRCHLIPPHGRFAPHRSTLGPSDGTSEPCAANAS
jgi:hypothetical protein